MTILDVHALNVFYGSTHALRGASISAGAGEVIAVLGPNGAGKTTLVRTIMGLVRPRSGSILFEGDDIVHRDPVANVHAGIVLCPEGRNLFEQLTVEENLRLGALRTGEPWRKLRGDYDEVVQLFPLIRERLHQRGGTLSGGEQQMVAIARSLLARPRLLLLDEPALGLAPRVVTELFALLPRLARGGMSILLIEQNASAALSVADRAYVLRQGEVISHGPANDVRHRTALESYLESPLLSKSIHTNRGANVSPEPTTEEFETPPADAHVVLEGGHYTLRPDYATPDDLRRAGVYYYQIVSDAAPEPYEIRRVQIENDRGKSWVVVDIPESVERGWAQDPVPHRVMKFQSPTESELYSLEKAIQAAKALAGRVAQVAVAFLIGDLYVPKELRKTKPHKTETIEWALPPEYKRLLATLGDIPYVLLRESSCRNLGHDRILEDAKATLADDRRLADLYARSGASILRDNSDDNRTLYLAADLLLDEAYAENPVIALTKGSSTPACATRLAGKMFELSRHKFTHLIAWYDVADDPEIRLKNIEGAMIAVCLAPAVDIDVQVITMEYCQVIQKDRLNTRELRRPGSRNGGYAQLLADTSDAARYLGLELISSRASAECCKPRFGRSSSMER